jgi:DNA-binding MarR family transcriptional regulator
MLLPYVVRPKKYLNVKITAHDHVDRVLAQWTRERPDLDTAPLAVVARVGRLARYFDLGLERVFAEHGVRRDTWDVLASLRRAGAPFRLSPTDLYRGLMRTSGAITNRLRRLERAGLIRRVLDPADGRSILVELTAEGRRLVDEVAPAHLENERRMLAALSPQEQRTLAELLRKLLASFEAESGESPTAHRRRSPRHTER